MKAKVVSVAVLAAAVLGTSAGISHFPARAASPAAAAVQTLPDFAAIAEANKAAVVNITSSAAAKPGANAPE
ncbi:MAG TPA: peptidase, partial [Burkholderiales bacterium]|nr:peptidase [Burkholderiales bacterium]